MSSWASSPSFAAGDRTSVEVGRYIGASPRYVQAFLDSCVVLGLLQADGKGYSLSPMASQYLVKGGREYVGDLVCTTPTRGPNGDAWTSW